MLTVTVLKLASIYSSLSLPLAKLFDGFADNYQVSYLYLRVVLLCWYSDDYGSIMVIMVIYSIVLHLIEIYRVSQKTPKTIKITYIVRI